MTRNTTTTTMDIEDFGLSDIDKYERGTIIFTKELLTIMGDISLIIIEKDIENEIKNIRRKLRIKQPSKIEMRECYEKYFGDIKINETLKRYLIKSAMRSDSGILVCTVVLSPTPNGTKFSCTYKCAYCPTETNKEGIPTQPKSYLSTEPAMLRATKYNFDMKGQIHDRLNAYVKQGNMVLSDDAKSAAKLEIIVSGGTWEIYPYEYRDRVITEIYWAANTFNNNREIKTLEEEKEINMTAQCRIIGLTLETRPDFITKRTIKDYIRWGVTRVQLGIQHFDDNILKLIKRDCTTQDFINANKLLRSAAFKIVGHLMPDLPGSSPELDKWMFNQALNNTDLYFDEVKIYPTAVCQTSETKPDLIVKSEISDWYREGKFVPYSEKNISDLINVLIYYKERIQPWIRIQRLVRDIPGPSIEAGYDKMSNFRQHIQEIMQKENKVCNCIRCKEIGSDMKHLKSTYLVVNEYPAAGGIEYFISIQAHSDFNIYEYIKYIIFIIYYYINIIFGNKIYWSGNLRTYKAIIGFCRLRIDSNPGGGFIKVLENCALIREVHVYGKSINVGSSGASGQHRGYGQLLVKTAEIISKKHGLNKVAIISGVGVREYYKNKCGYYLDGNYMIKNI